MSKMVPMDVVAGLTNNTVPDAALALSKMVTDAVPAVVITRRHKRPGAALITTVFAPDATAWLNCPPTVLRVSAIEAACIFTPLVEPATSESRRVVAAELEPPSIRLRVHTPNLSLCELSLFASLRIESLNEIRMRLGRSGFCFDDWLWFLHRSGTLLKESERTQSFPS